MFADKPAASLSDCYLGLLRILFVKQTTYATSETAMLGLIEWVEYNGFSTCLLARPGFLWKGLSFTTLPSPFKSYSIHSNINVWKYISLSRLPSDENGDLIQFLSSWVSGLWTQVWWEGLGKRTKRCQDPTYTSSEERQMENKNDWIWTFISRTP